MYNPLPYLPPKFKNLIRALRKKKLHPKLLFLILGLLATIWFLIRVIPKPSRVNYPCVKATAPVMSGFVLYILSLGSIIVVLKYVKKCIIGSKLIQATLFLFLAVSLYFISQTQLPAPVFANNMSFNQNNFTPNTPIGVAQGIYPGRVVWMWNPDATNKSCTNTSNNSGLIDSGDDAWFMEINNDQSIIDDMIDKSLLSLTGASDNHEAWSKIFKYYNNKNQKGNVDYTNNEKIFIKINATTAYGGLAGEKYDSNLNRNDNLNINDFAAETNPFVVLSMLRQLVDVANIPENMIYIGDPARNIYQDFYKLWHNEFPDVNYLGNNLLHPELNITTLGRVPVAVTEHNKVFYSDNGTVMPDAISDKLFTVFDSIDYLINIPTMKAHATAGITLSAKNHFGSFTRNWALHLHSGLMENNDNPTRLGYELYRVQTDIMMHNLLSGKNLLMIVDGLYPGEDALGVPGKWNSIPFENDWCSSIFMSLDPVAIESVCHDFLRTEYNGSTIAQSRPNWFGVDDYLHQAADSSLWPESVKYDPDQDGILIASLGVHEHWNDSLNKQYTRNLETGDGIELIKVHELENNINVHSDQINVSVYPNPVFDYLKISNIEDDVVKYQLSDLNGKFLLMGEVSSFYEARIDLTSFKKGIYIINLQNSTNKQSIRIVKQ